MTVEECIVYGKSKITSAHAKMLLADMLQVNPLELFNILDRVLEDSLTEEYCKKVEQLQKNRPIQYIMNNVNFYGQKFYVDERVLIPRFETEQLVEETLKRIEKLFPQKQWIKIIDLGCGSGVIGLTLKNKLPDADLTLVDLSKEALEVARFNAKNLNLEVHFLKESFLEKNTEQYDVIISNPPYIKTKEEIEDIVRENEPAIALYAGEDGLDCYREILSQCRKNLKEQYLIAFEIGYTQALEIKAIAEQYLEDAQIEIMQDLSGKDRMIFIQSRNTKNLVER